MEEVTTYQPGDIVDHKVLGRGIVVSFNDDGPDSWATRIRIKFQQGGEKELLFAFCAGKLTKATP